MTRRLRIVIETLLVNALIASSLYQLLVYLANRRFWRQEPLPPPDESPAVSVIMPLHGKTLDTLALLYLAAINGPSDEYELILVMDDDSGPAYPLAREIAAEYPDVVRMVLCGPPGDHVPQMHRFNAGYSVAHGDLIAFAQSGVQISGELWAGALAALADPGVGAVFAPPLLRESERHTDGPIPTGGETLTTLHTNHAHTAGLPFAALSNRVKSIADGFVVVRRSVMDEVGGMLHLLDHAAGIMALGHAIREMGYVIKALPIPALIVPEPESFNEATAHIRQRLVLNRVTLPPDFVAWPFTNPLTVGFLLGLITEREGRWWGRQTWYFFVWLRMAIAVELDRIRFGQPFGWGAYAQLFMLDTFIAPALWAQALARQTITLGERTFRVFQGGRVEPED